MAITWNETAGRSLKIDRMGNRQYSIPFLGEVIFPDTQWVGPVSMLQALNSQKGITIGKSYVWGAGQAWYEYDSLAWCVDISLQCTSSDGRQWTAQAEFETISPDQLTPATPIDAWPRHWWNHEATEKPIYQTSDSSPKKIVNSAGDPFTTQLTRPKPIGVLTIVRNETTFVDTIASNYLFTVNNADWTVLGYTFKARTMQCMAIDAVPQYHNILGDYFETTYKFRYDIDTYDLKIMDAGLNYLDSSFNKVEIRNYSGLPVTRPVALDGAGNVLPSSATGPVFLTYNVLANKDFTTGFNFPTTAHRPLT
jgi:hypothetical protein